MAKKGNKVSEKDMYGVVTQQLKVEIRGHRLPRFTYKVNKKTKKVTLRRIAWLFIRLYRYLPERPTSGPDGMAISKSAQQKRIEFAMRASRQMTEQGWKPNLAMRDRLASAMQEKEALENASKPAE